MAQADHLTVATRIGSDDDADAEPPPAAEVPDALVEEEAYQAPPPPPPVPLFTEAQACELVEHPTTDSLKVSWAEVVQTGIAGSVPDGVDLPACSLNYELALREVRPHHPLEPRRPSAVQQTHPDRGRVLPACFSPTASTTLYFHAAMTCTCCAIIRQP